jgi:hypothetical protein
MSHSESLTVMWGLWWRVLLVLVYVMALVAMFAAAV